MNWSHWESHGKLFGCARANFCFALLFPISSCSFFSIVCISKSAEIHFRPNRNHIQLHFTEASFIFVRYLKSALSKQFRIFWFPGKKTFSCPHHIQEKEQTKRRKKAEEVEAYVELWILRFTITGRGGDGGSQIISTEGKKNTVTWPSTPEMFQSGCFGRCWFDIHQWFSFTTYNFWMRKIRTIYTIKHEKIVQTFSLLCTSYN